MQRPQDSAAIETSNNNNENNEQEMANQNISSKGPDSPSSGSVSNKDTKVATNTPGHMPVTLPRDAKWYASILTPLLTLSQEQINTLGICIFISLIETYTTAAVVDAYPSIFYTGLLGPGQLCGFFFFFMATALAVITKISPTVFCEEFNSIARAAAEFGAYMVLFFLVDRTTIVPRANKRHDMNLFWILWAALVGVGLCTLRRAKPPAPPAPAASSPTLEDGAGPTAATQQAQQQQALLSSGNYHIKHLQRDQTEEWKGWMQVMFLWYHYFNATEIYNVIRLYIAAYVWMTGFGNFSYYYIKRDFCMNRFVAMQWRLNFMVTWTCAILGNEYMLYYICPLHTIFTLMIYFGLGIRSDLNYTRWGLVMKFGVLILAAVVMWDIKGVFQTVWRPLKFLLQYNDPYRPSRDVMSEWEFRTFLDHLVWVVGMFMACQHPRFDSWLERLDQLPAKTTNTIKGAVVAACCFGFYWYYNAILSLPKKQYNAVHPYTSFIPIVLFIVLRNIFTTARQYHLHLFEFLGKTTLETYIAQFHIWMATTGLNGSPKKILALLPEDWFVTNFLLVSVLFFAVSYRLFQCTNAIRPILVPAKASDEVVKRNVALGFIIVAAAYVVCYIIAVFRNGSAAVM